MSSDRIALLFATSGHSGVDRVVANLLPEFEGAGRPVDLLVIGGHGPAVPEAATDNLRVIRLPVRTKKLVLPALVPYLLRHRPRALLTANHQLNRAALMARVLTGLPARVTIRMGMSLTAVGETLSPRRRRQLFASMARWYPRADAVIAPSEGVGTDLKRIAGVPRERLHVIRNPIVNEALTTLASEPVDHSWFAADEVPVVLGVGSLEPRKDFATLIRAFARLHEQRPCRLVILGEGEQRQELETLARTLGVADAVDLPGFRRNPYAYMARAGVFALTSRREGASAVIVEAMACGTPAVSTDCPSGPAEILSGLDPPALVPVGDDAALAECLAAVLDAPPSEETLRQRISAHDSQVSARAYMRAVLG